MTKVHLTTGSYATVDDAFLRDSILNPTMHTTAGYAPIMPTYQGQISEEELIDLVEYIKQLNSSYRIQQTLNTSPAQNPTSVPGQHTASVAPGIVKP
jgi:cytochrome c oxidase subunit 2